MSTAMLPPDPHSSREVCSPLSTAGRWCRELPHVAIAPHRVLLCQGCGNCDVYFGKKGHYYEMSHCLFLITVSHKKS